MGQRDGFIRLAGEMSTRTMHARGLATPSTRPVRAAFRGTPYEVMVFSGTVATTMTARGCGDAMLALLARGATEESVTALLRQWAAPAAPRS